MNARHLVVPLALVAAAGSAFAQDSSRRTEVQLQGSFDQPLGSSRRVVTQQGATSQVKMVKIVDGKTWSLSITDGEISVEEDGKPVPADRLRRSDATLEILDNAGKVVESFELPEGLATPAPRMVDVPAAPVMIGILMEYDQEAGGLVVQHAYEGMPGDKAGLKAGDVITEVAGKSVTGNESLREALKDRKPGDRIDLTVKDQAGQSRIRTIELVKFDQDALAKARAEVDPGAFGTGDIFRDLPGFMQGFSLDDPALRDRVRKAVEEAMESIKQSTSVDAEKWKQSAIDALEKALAAVEEQSGTWRRQLRGGTNAGSMPRAMTFQGMPGRVFEIPATPNVPAAPGPSAEQFQKLIDSMDRLATRLETLEKRLEDRK